MEALTDRQAAILEFIRDEIAANGCPPTVRQIGARFRMASTFGVRRHLEALERKGCIERIASSPRGIRLSPELSEVSGLPLVGKVAAGTPIDAVENLEGTLALESGLGPRKELFCLRVQGDSMTGAGIEDGDIAIVRKKDDFEDGEIGVAVVDGEATVKRVFRTGDGIELRPANDAYDPIRVTPEQDFRYAGQVVGVRRDMRPA